MKVLNQVDYIERTSPKIYPDPDESVLMECGRLIHAAVINRRFQSKLLTDPIQSIEDGFCGEKFSFTREEKQQIQQIHASSLAEFANLLFQAVRLSCRIPTASEMSFARLGTPKELSA